MSDNTPNTPNTPKRRSSKGKSRPANRVQGTDRAARIAVRPDSRRAQRVVATQKAQQRRRLGLIGGAIGVAVVVAIVLIGFNVLGDDDGDAGDEAIVIPTTVNTGAVASPDSSPQVATDGTPEPGTGSDTPSGTVLTLGDPNAPVKVVEWADYQCPACGNFANTIEPQFVEEYVDTGQVYYEFHDFAFLGAESTRAAEASHCAEDQGRGWDFHRTLFSNQDGENEGAFSDERLVQMAEGIGLDAAAFETCLDEGTYADAVVDSLNAGREQGVDSTPTFFINDEKVVGVQGYEQFAQHIEDALGS